MQCDIRKIPIEITNNKIEYTKIEQHASNAQIRMPRSIDTKNNANHDKFNKINDSKKY